jgi:hypothetical protein
MNRPGDDADHENQCRESADDEGAGNDVYLEDWGVQNRLPPDCQALQNRSRVDPRQSGAEQSSEQAQGCAFEEVVPPYCPDCIPGCQQQTRFVGSALDEEGEEEGDEKGGGDDQEETETEEKAGEIGGPRGTLETPGPYRQNAESRQLERQLPRKPGLELLA